MFQRGIAKHQSEQQPQSSKAASSLFPPKKPSPSSQQKDIQSAFRNSPSTQWQRCGGPGGTAGGNTGHTLKNSQSQTFNARPPPPGPSKHPSPNTVQEYPNSQRSSQSGSQLFKTLDNDTAFQENALPTELSSVSTSLMNSLHEAVYFDENDFDDDLDLSLDFNVDEPLIPADLKAAVANIPQSSNPTLPKPTAATAQSHEDVPNSSAPLPWSSSPIRQLPTMPAPRRPTAQVSSQESVTQVKPTRNFTTSTKRGLPWPSRSKEKHVEHVEHADEEEPQAKRSRNRKPREKTQQALEQAPETPPHGPSMPWDTTASAAKIALQEFKGRISIQKRSITTKAADPEHQSKILRETPSRVFLSEEQSKVIKLVMESGKSVFFTGAAGTGKSVLLRELILELRNKYKKDMDRVAVTASTGLAACNIGGVTLHSFSGIGLGKEAPADLVRKIKRNAKAKSRWLRTKVLIIDEISMVDGELFDKLEAVARQIKNNGRPFGGIQLVITGDFFQLPPVPDNNRVSKFAFEADTWNTSIDHTIGLRQVFRQRDSAFADMLNEMRLGKLSQRTIDSFKSLHRPLIFDDGIQATELFPTRNEVDSANNAKMRQLAGKIEVFDAIDSGSTTDPKTRNRLLSNCMAPQRIELKINSQVMLIKNIDETLVNGSLGRVVGFMNDHTFELVRAEGDLEEFVAGAYNEGTSSCDEETLMSRRQARLKAKVAAAKVSAAASRVWPLVQFIIPDGSTRHLLIQPEQWKVELPNGEIQASRFQIPLILAWALSIHKAQGQTLERVKVDLGKVFEKGQAYVALSRATCQEGLQVLRFDSNKVMAHEKVRRFYASLYSALDAGAGAGAGAGASTSMTGIGLATTDRKVSATTAAKAATTATAATAAKAATATTAATAATMSSASASVMRQPTRRTKDEVLDSQGEEDYDDLDFAFEDERKRKPMSSYG